MTDAPDNSKAEVDRLLGSIPVPRVRVLAERLAHAQAVARGDEPPQTPRRRAAPVPSYPMVEADRLIEMYERTHPKRR